MNARLEFYLSDGRSPREGLARESWLVERAATGHCCLLAYSLRHPAVILGFGQPADDVDLEWCWIEGIPVLRRITGGTGVIHDKDLAISLALPIGHPWCAGITGLYGLFLDALAPGLRAVGSRVERTAVPRRAGVERSPICFEDQSSDTLLIDGRKAVGCAQTRRRHSVLIDAAVLLGLDSELYAAVFGVTAERVSSGLAPAVTGVPSIDVAQAVGESIASELNLDLEKMEAPDLEQRFLAPWTTRKWAPVR